MMENTKIKSPEIYPTHLERLEGIADLNEVALGKDEADVAPDNLHELDNIRIVGGQTTQSLADQSVLAHKNLGLTAEGHAHLDL